MYCPFFFQSMETELTEVSCAPTVPNLKAVCSSLFHLGVLSFAFEGLMEDPTSLCELQLCGLHEGFVECTLAS